VDSIMRRLEKSDADAIEQTFPRGIVDARRTGAGLKIARIPRRRGLEAVFDNHYLIEWDLARGQAEWHRVLPSPNANRIFGTAVPALDILVSNADDHLRKHAFLHDDKGWRLAPVYDLNRCPTSCSRTSCIRPVSAVKTCAAVAAETAPSISAARRFPNHHGMAE
jgi:hypothetical protein